MAHVIYRTGDALETVFTYHLECDGKDFASKEFDVKVADVSDLDQWVGEQMQEHRKTCPEADEKMKAFENEEGDEDHVDIPDH